MSSLNVKVFVYFNLHRKCLSVKALEGEHKGRVIAYASSVGLINCTFKVSEAGRQRVLREKRKNVHAGVVGHLFEMGNDHAVDIMSRIADPIKYNPYKFASFVHAVTETPVHKAGKPYVVSNNGRGAIYALR